MHKNQDTTKKTGFEQYIPNSMIMLKISIGLIFFAIVFQVAFAETVSVSVEGENYDIDYVGDGVTISEAVADEGFASIIFVLDVAEPGILEITIERSLLDAKFEGEDEEFFVLEDGLPISFDESKTVTSRTLTMDLPTGTEEIEIIGTEFTPTVESQPEETPKESEPEPQPEKEIPAPFVDESKESKSYVQRYVTESSYKDWFEANYPNYTFYEALDISKSEFDSLVSQVQSELKSETPKTETPNESETECGPGTILKDGQCVVVCGPGTELVDGKCKAIPSKVVTDQLPDAKVLGKEFVVGIIASFVIAGAVIVILGLISRANKSKDY